MKAIRQLLEKHGPMPLAEFYASACAIVPAEATQYGKRTRFSVVKRWMRLHQERISVTDDVICLITRRKVSAISTLLNLLKTNGTVSFEQTGMRNRHTFAVYICEMRKLNWITNDEQGQITWCGPNEASAVTVSKVRKLRVEK